MKFYYDLYYCGRKSNATPILTEHKTELHFLRELNDWNRASLLAGKNFLYIVTKRHIFS